jgi:hypothetical protein
MPWRPDPLLRAVLLWTSLLGSVFIWLPLVRGLTQGAAYPWMLVAGIGGRGVGGGYWMLVPMVVWVLGLLYLGVRSARPPFHVLLLAFHLPLAAAALYAAWFRPDVFHFEGATIGASLSFGYLAPAVIVAFAAAAVVWVVRDLRRGQARPAPPWQWTRANRIRLALVLALLPVEFVLFHSGGIQSPANLAGVFLVFWQWVMVNVAMELPRSQARALAT